MADPTKEGQGEAASQGETTPPETVEFEFEGENFKVPSSVAEKLKGGILRHSDYTKKTQELSEQKKGFEEDAKVAMNLNSFIESNPDKAEMIGAILRGEDVSKLKEEDEEDLPPAIKKKIDVLERKLTDMAFKSEQTKYKDVVMNELLEKYPEAKKYMSQIKEALKSNPLEMAYLVVSADDRLKSKKDGMRKEIKQEVLREYMEKITDTPMVGSAGGAFENVDTGNLEQCAAAAMAKLKEAGDF